VEATAKRGRRLPWWAIVGLLVVVVVAVVALLGGFSAVPTASLPQIKLGTVETGNEASTRVTSVTLSPVVPRTDREAPSGKQYVVVHATATNTTTTPSTIGTDLLRIVIDGAVEPTAVPDNVIDVRGNGIGMLQPGLATRLQYAWLVPDTVKAGDRIYIGIFERHPISGDPVFGNSAFTRPQVAARIVTTIGAAR
jgi:hypothetical protein